MADVERMWTEGWLEYELYVEKKLDLEDIENNKNTNVSDIDLNNLLNESQNIGKTKEN